MSSSAANISQNSSPNDANGFSVGVSNFDEDVIDFNLSGKDGESASQNPEIYIDMIVDSYTEPTQIEVLLESPGETQYWTFPESVSVQNFKVNYQHTYEAPDTSPSGTWFVRKIRLTNAEGEVITYDKALLDNKGFTTSVDIENVIGDVNAP